MYFIDFLGRVLLPLFYSPIFFTIAYENLFRGGVNKSEQEYSQTMENMEQKSESESSHKRIETRLLVSGIFCMATGIVLVFMTYTNLINFIG